MSDESGSPKTEFFQRIIGRIETGIYVAIGVLLVFAAALLIATAAWHFASEFGLDHISDQVLLLVGQLLLALLVIELLYTVRVALRARRLMPDPFIIVGLIAAMRRVLLITAETWHLEDINQQIFERAMLELGLLTALTLTLVISLVLLRRYQAQD